MITFSNLDIIIISAFFLLVLVVGFIPRLKSKSNEEEFLLSGRSIGLFVFVLTNVATWYGGILGIGEFTYQHGLVSWLTQGLPYYIFAIIFALLFAEKIRDSQLFTIPEKLEESYGRKVGIISSVLIFILVSPAAYLLMISTLLSLIFEFPLWISLIISSFFSAIYLIVNGYKSDISTDIFEFFVMFSGFIVLVFTAYSIYGGMEFLQTNLPESHLKFTGNVSITYIVVWFMIALWTFSDPGFHLRCYAAKSGKVAKYGILISVILWAFFDFLTTSSGLYSRALIQDMVSPLYSFPLLAEKVLGSGLKGIFYAALFATILSTLNSLLFLSGTTFGKDFGTRLFNITEPKKIIRSTRIGIVVSIIFSIVLSLYFKSVIEMWYVIGSICIPGLILLIVGAYFPKFKVSKNIAAIEIIAASAASIIFYFARAKFNILLEIEPMVVGLSTALGIHLFGLNSKRRFAVGNSK
ncbi:MAG: sodium:solute symporter family protein [Bacteroidota bacterium]